MNEEQLKLFLSRSQKFHVIKFKNLILKLNNNKNLKHFIDFEVFRTIKARTLIDFGSDFFWQNVHILSASIDKGNLQILEKDFFYFSLSFFDSYFHKIQTNEKIYFPIINEYLTLPILGIQTNKKIKVLKKTSKTSLELICDNKTTLIDLTKIEKHFEFQYHTLTNGIIVVKKTTTNLFYEEEYSDVCDNELLIQELILKFENAFEIIKSTDFSLFEKIINNIDYIIPYGINSDLLYPNFTTASLKRTLFLSIDLLKEENIHTAECIIHESSHCELNIIQDTQLLTQSPYKLKYYSPWRKDLRPLLGLIHGIYISNQLILFYFKIIEQDRFKGIYLIISKIIHQVIVAINEIEEDELTLFTKELLKNIKENIKQISKELSISLYLIPKEVENHIKQWKNTPLKVNENENEI